MASSDSQVVEGRGEIKLEGIGPPVTFTLTDYQDFQEDLRLLGVSPQELMRTLGRTVQSCYRWKLEKRVPQYVRAYLDLAFQIKSLS